MRETLTLDNGTTLEQGDALLDTRAAVVKRFHGAVIESDGVLDTEHALFHTARTLENGFDPERETKYRVNARFTPRTLGSRYVTTEEFPLPVGEHTEIGAWRLNRVDGEKLATWIHGPYTLTVGKGYATTTRADYGVALKRPKVKGEGATSTREECIFRADSFEQALSGAVAFMENVTIEEHGVDDHAFEYFRLGKLSAPLYPEDIEEGDIVEFHQMVKELTLSSKPDEILANGGRATGERKSDETYVGEVISKTEDTLHIAKYNGFTSSTAVIHYDQLAAKLV